MSTEALSSARAALSFNLDPRRSDPSSRLGLTFPAHPRPLIDSSAAAGCSRVLASDGFNRRRDLAHNKAVKLDLRACVVNVDAD